jgi:hypothetical protein
MATKMNFILKVQDAKLADVQKALKDANINVVSIMERSTRKKHNPRNAPAAFSPSLVYEDLDRGTGAGCPVA